MPISLEQWRLAIGLWNARIQRTLIIRRGVKRAPSCQEGSHSASLQSHSGEKMFKTRKKARKKHKDGSLGDQVIATGDFCNALPVLGAPTTLCSVGNECSDGSSRSPVAPLLELLGCTVLGALLVIVMLLLRSGDVESNPGPVEEGASCLLDVGSKPTLEELDKLIVGCCSGWEQAALHLRVQSYVLETEKWDNPNNAEEACRGVLRRWLLHAPGTGETVRTWHSVLKALETSGHGQLAEQLKRDHFAESSEGRPIPVMSVGASCLLEVGSKPTLEELDKLIVGRCSGWEQTALCLGVQSYVLETEKWDNHENPGEACRGVLRRWLLQAPGTGETERTWHSVLEALETSGHSQLTEQLKREHFPFSQPVVSVGDQKCDMMLRTFVSRVAAGKGRAVLEGLGLPEGMRKMCFENNPLNVEEAIQCGLLQWKNGHGNSPTWDVLLRAMAYAEFPVQDVKKLKEEILKGPDEEHTSGLRDKKQNCLYDSPLALEYIESVTQMYSKMPITQGYPDVDYVGLNVIRSHPSVHTKEDTAQFLRNFQKATVDYISQRNGRGPRIAQKDQVTSGLLTHDHFLQQQEKKLHIIFGPPGVGKTSFSRQICSQFSSAPKSSSFSLVLLFYVREKRVAEAKTVADLLSCYGLPDDDLNHNELARLIVKSKGKGLQIIFDGLDERPGLLKDNEAIVTRLLKGELAEAQIVVTSRPGIMTQLSELWHMASFYEVQGFGPEEVNEYVESFFCKEGDPSAASKFLSALENRPDLTGSTYIPLNLWLLCSVFSFKDCTLPDTLTQCYTALFARLLHSQAKKEGEELFIGHTLDGLPESMQTTLDCLSKLSYLCFLEQELVFDEEVVIRTCLSSRAELKHTFYGMGLLSVHPKQHGDMDHLTFNFLHSTYQEYLCAKHIHGMSKEQQTAFWKKYISNPRYAMVFRFYCGLSHLQIKGVQDIVKGQELPRQCNDDDRRLLFLFYALHESGNTHLTAAIARQLDRALKFQLKMSSYDFYVTGYCLSKADHLTKLDFRAYYPQKTKDAIPCIASVAFSNPLVSLDLALTDLSLLDAKRVTSALTALEKLTLKLNASSGDAVEKVLFIPTLRKLDLTVGSVSDWHTRLHPKSQSDVANLDLDLPSKGLANCCFQMEELRVQRYSKDAGDIIAAHLPKWKNLRKVEVEGMNPVPILLSAISCGKLAEVVVVDPNHCTVPADGGSEVSADFSARHLRRLELQEWSGVDSEVLKTCFSIVSSYSSLEELEVECDTPDAGDVIAAHLPKWKSLRKVQVEDMNPVPILLSAMSCGKLAEVAIGAPKHCKATSY